MNEPLTPVEIVRHVAVLNDSRDAEELTAAASALAASQNRDGVIALARVLRNPEFLALLEGSSDGTTEDVTNLATVFLELATHPSETTGRLCELIYAEERFRELPVRINLILGALAPVTPVTDQAMSIFRETSTGGFAPVSAPLLLRNMTPRALELFSEIITGDAMNPGAIVDILRRSLLPLRDQLPVLRMCSDLLEKGLKPEVRAGLIEALFDYQSRYWFGPAMGPPVPIMWPLVSTEALEYLVRLAGQLLSEKLEDRLQAAVNTTKEEMLGILRSRRE